MGECPFCNPLEERIVLRNARAYVLRDGFPVTPLHTLVIPVRHVRDYFELTQEEVLACDALIRDTSSALQASDPNIEGFNIGVNAGEVAGQTIFHCHFHLIPRRRGDVPNPRGGVRNTIPGRGDY